MLVVLVYWWFMVFVFSLISGMQLLIIIGIYWAASDYCDTTVKEIDMALLTKMRILS